MDPLSNSFLGLVKIMDELREQCPWDKKQTIDTLRPLTIEETYELADAITDHDWEGIKEELGDILLHLLFYSKIGTEQNEFTLQEVIDGISAKLVHRHPDIYGDVKVADEEDVKRNWEKLKMKEGKKSVLSGVPPSLPAIVKATRIQKGQSRWALSGTKKKMSGKEKKRWASCKRLWLQVNKRKSKKNLEMFCLVWQIMHGVCRYDA
jgi:XTP/dITP diphosphohydrolase